MNAKDWVYFVQGSLCLPLFTIITIVAFQKYEIAIGILALVGAILSLAIVVLYGIVFYYKYQSRKDSKK
jgi:hypothetical protein